MSDVKIKIKVDKNAVKTVDKIAYRTLAQTAIVLQDEIREEQIIPRRDGHLQGEKFFVDDSSVEKGLVALVFEGPYARRLYYHPEYHFHREEWVDKQGRKHGGNINAQAYWLAPWEKGGKYQDRPAQIFTELLKRGL